MNNKAIYFIGGFIWALVSSRKAYAPNINTSIDNRPKSQADCTDMNKPFFHYYPKSADSRQLEDEMMCASVPQGSFNSKGIIVQG
jgi:hypothetical protein